MVKHGKHGKPQNYLEAMKMVRRLEIRLAASDKLGLTPQVTRTIAEGQRSLQAAYVALADLSGRILDPDELEVDPETRKQMKIAVEIVETMKRIADTR